MWLNNQSPDKANISTTRKRGEGQKEGGKEPIREQLNGTERYITLFGSRQEDVCSGEEDVI